MKLFMPNFGFPDYDDHPALSSQGPRRQVRVARRDAEIAAAYQSGTAVPELAAQFEMSRMGIYSALKREGVALTIPRSRGTLLKTERNAEIVEKYKAGASAEAIGQEYGITRERVCQFLRPLNLSQLKAERTRAAREIVAAEREAIKAEIDAKRATDLERAVEIVRNGGSRNDAVRATGLPINAVLKACLDAGLPHHHGRWMRDREFEERKARIRAMRAAGKTWVEIGKAQYTWAVKNMPELINQPA